MINIESTAPKEYLTKKFNIDDDFKKFDQKYDMFNRAHWDESINPHDFFKSYDMSQCVFRNTEGFTQWDFALRNSGWHLADFVSELKEESEDRREGFLDYYTIQRSGAKIKADLQSPKKTTGRIKKAAKFLGAGIVGVCERDERWIYSRNYSRITKESKSLEISEELKYVVVAGVPMDYMLSKSYPSALGGCATGLGYTHDLMVLTSITQLIRNLGYKAIGSLNDTALSIPMALQAGLGEYGRNGLLITKDYGSRLRLGKVFTDLPLVPDKPQEFGVSDFCNICNRCAESCPSKAIPFGSPQSDPPNKSSLGHLTKWTVNAEKCFNFWVNSNTECAICIRICPYNKDFSQRRHRIALPLAGTFLRKPMSRLDKLLGYGKWMQPIGWWEG